MRKKKLVELGKELFKASTNS